MKNLILAALLMGSALGAQKIKTAESLKPFIGIHYTGGTQYKMDHEPLGLQAGLTYTFKKPLLFASGMSVNSMLNYDPYPKSGEADNAYYVLKVQMIREIKNGWAVTYYGGYVDDFRGDLMRQFSGDYKTNFAYGLGGMLTDELISAQVMLEMLAGYPHFTVGVNYNFNNLLRKNENQKY